VLVNQPFNVDMYVSAESAESGVVAQAFLDPFFFLDQNVIGLGYTLQFNNGIGNSLATTTPIPAALPLFATGLGALGLLGWRRKRKVN